MKSNQGTRLPVYGIVGADAFLRRETLQGLLRQWGSAASMRDVTVYEPTVSLAEVLDDVRTPSLLGDHRIVVVDDADEFISQHRAALERYVGKPADTGTLILMPRTMPKNTRLYNAISVAGAVHVCTPPRGQAVGAWIAQRAEQVYGKSIAPRAATLMRDHVGDAPGALDAELAKVSDYVGRRAQVTVEDIESITGRHREEKVFAITDAMAGGDAATALIRWDQVLQTDRAAPGRAIAGLAWSVRKLLEARRGWVAGVRLQQLAPMVFTDPATLRKRLERTSEQQLMAQQRALLQADLAIKTGVGTAASAVEKFIVRHSAQGGAA